MMVSWPPICHSIKSRLNRTLLNREIKIFESNTSFNRVSNSLMWLSEMTMDNWQHLFSTNQQQSPTFFHITYIWSSTSCSSQYSICCFASSHSNMFQCARFHYRTHSNRYVSTIERLSTCVHHQTCQSILRPIQCSIGDKTAERTRLL